MSSDAFDALLGSGRGRGAEEPERERGQGYESLAHALADELVRRQEEDGLEGMSGADVIDAAESLGLKLRDITPPAPRYQQFNFYLERMGATVLILMTFKHGCLDSVAIYRELQREYFS